MEQIVMHVDKVHFGNLHFWPFAFYPKVPIRIILVNCVLSTQRLLQFEPPDCDDSVNLLATTKSVDKIPTVFKS